MRIRTVKPEFFTHEAIFDAEKEESIPLRLSFIGLWCAADREGRFKWEPRRLGVQILPYDQHDFSDILDALEKHGFIVRYGEGQYGWIPSFSSHQCVNQREAQSKIPAPEECFTDEHLHACEPGYEYNGVNIQPKLRAFIFTRDGDKCKRCGSEDDLTVDHIFPRSIGGTHHQKNLRTLCRSCNSARPVAGKGLVDDLAKDNLTLDDMQSMCMHVQARGEGKGREQGKERIPPNPQGGTKRKKSNPKITRVESNTETMARINGWFGRRPDTLWTISEADALDAINPTEAEIEGMEHFYLAQESEHEPLHRRTALITLLNNWPSELDKARGYARRQRGAA